MVLSNSKIVAFDIDGTILDSTAAIVYSLNQALKVNGFAELPSSQIAKSIGRPIDEFLRKFLPDDLIMTSVVKDFRSELGNNGYLRTKIFPGITSALSLLRQQGILCAVATNKNTDLAVKVLSDMELDSYFSLIIGQDKALPKPSPLMLEIIKKELSGELLAYCGDTIDDIQSARNAGVKSIAIAGGVNSTSELEDENPTFLISTAIELEQLLREEFIK